MVQNRKQIGYGTGAGSHTRSHSGGSWSDIQNTDNGLRKQNLRRSEKLQLRSKRGSYIAEAAVVLPSVILSVITVILILLLFYETSVSQSRMHMHLRSEAAVLSRRMTCNENAWDGSCTVERDGVFRNVKGCGRVAMTHGGLLKEKGIITVKGSWYAADGVAFKRTRRF